MTMFNAARKYFTSMVLVALVAFGAADSAQAQFFRFGGGGMQGGRMQGGGMQGGGMMPMGPMQGGYNSGGMFGGGMRPSGGGLLDGLFNSGGWNNGYGNYPAPVQPYGNQVVPNGYMIDPNTGRYLQGAPATYPGMIQQQQTPIQQPAMTQTRVYDPTTNRIYIQETNQLTGEMWDPVNQRVYTPTAETARTSTAAAAPAQPAATTAQPAASTAQPAATAAQPDATAAQPAEPPKPVGPPRNFLMAKIAAPADAVRKQVRNLIRTTAYDDYVVGELETVLSPVLFSDADRERLLGLATRKESVNQDQLDLLNNAIDQLDAVGVRIKLEKMDMGRDQYAGVTERIALSKVYREITEAGFQSPSRTKQAINKLENAAARAGLPRELLQSIAQRLDAFSRINQVLEDSDAGSEGLDLAGVTPDTAFTVVRWRGYSSPFPCLLAANTLLMPLRSKSPGLNKLTIETVSAAELGLPIYGSSNPPVPDASTQAPPASTGVVFRVDPQAVVDATIFVTDEQEKLAYPYTLKPGASMPFPNRASVQMAFSDGRGGQGAWATVAAGTYILTAPGGFWQRSVEPAPAIIDNSANGYPFNYRIAGVDGIVPARQVVAINRPTASTPIEFNRGVGDSVANKVLAGKDARFAVRLASNGGLDLFQPDGGMPTVASTIADPGPIRIPIDPTAIGANPPPSTPPLAGLEFIQPRFPVGTLDE
jgi:hypothetical protein